MAVSTYTTNMTDLLVGAGDSGNCTGLGGGASGLNNETDYFIQGTGCTTKNAFASARKGFIWNSAADRASLPGTDGAFLMWVTHATPNSLDTIANGGITMLVGSSTSDYKHYYVGGSDTIEFMGWILAAVNPSETADEADAGTPSAVEQYFGVLWDLPTGGPTKGAPNAMDAIRAGRCDIIYELGTSTDPDASFELAVTNRGDVTDRWGLIQLRNGSYFCSGLHQLGSSTNVVNFTDSNKSMFWNDHPAVTAPFNTLEIQNASSVVNMTNISWKALGTKSPGTWVTTDNATVNLTTCSFIDWGQMTFASNTTVDTCTFLGCLRINHGGATMNGSSVVESQVAADEGALFYDEAVDPDGEMDGMTFSKGTNAHHAIRFGTNVPAAMTLRNCTFTGFGSTDDANDSVFRFDDTTGNITLNLIGCTTDGTFSVDDAAGVTVTIVLNPVTTLVHIDDDTGASLQNARVFLEASSAAGDLPYRESVTITRSGSTASVSHTAHGLSNGDKVAIRGANEQEYNGVFAITNVTTNAYDYTVSGTPGTPATGTITSTGVVLEGLTDASGNISASRSFTLDQPVTGRVRKSSSGATRFKSFSLAGNTVDNTNGLTINVRMIKDE
jgi:hypothetical protein